MWRAGHANNMVNWVLAGLGWWKKSITVSLSRHVGRWAKLPNHAWLCNAKCIDIASNVSTSKSKFANTLDKGIIWSPSSNIGWWCWGWNWDLWRIPRHDDWNSKPWFCRQPKRIHAYGKGIKLQGVLRRWGYQLRRRGQYWISRPMIAPELLWPFHTNLQ